MARTVRTRGIHYFPAVNVSMAGRISRPGKATFSIVVVCIVVVCLGAFDKFVSAGDVLGFWNVRVSRPPREIAKFI